MYFMKIIYLWDLEKNEIKCLIKNKKSDVVCIKKTKLNVVDQNYVIVYVNLTS